MPDYANGKIYKLVSNKTNEVYIGSTTQALCVRFASHKSDYKRNTNISSCKLMKFDDVQIILIETFPCKSKEELHSREYEIIKQHNNYVNELMPTRTDKEWRDETQYNKKYYNEHKEDIKVDAKKYREEHKEQIRLYETSDLVKQRKNEHKKKTYESESKNKVQCECGSFITKYTKGRHIRSQKHTSFTLIGP